jgi:hypothetical protein
MEIEGGEITMTTDERKMASRLLDEIDQALPPTAAAIMGRAAAKALRELLEFSHGAGDHGARKPRTRRRGRIAPELVSDQALAAGGRG